MIFKYSLTQIKLTVLSCFLMVSSSSIAQAQKKNKKAGAEIKQEQPNPDGPKPYAKIITAKAITEEGLFTVHRVGEKHYFELPNNLLEKEILIVSRISGHVSGLNFGGAGMKSRPQQVIRFQKLNDKILMRSVSYNNIADEETPIYTSVVNNNFEPVISTFPVAAYGADSLSVVIEVTPLFTTDVEMIGALNRSEIKQFEIKGLDKTRSLITSMNAFPENVLVKHILTYNGNALPDNRSTGTLSVGMTQSFILLPEVPMEPRYFDQRVGFFSLQQIDYGADEQKAAKRQIITRWRLEPTDWDAYLKGELVEPVKPIVYYIDAATPEKWKKYIKMGVDDWQKAFEKAGFKNAIRGEYAPTIEENPDWTPEDVRYSVIRYIATDIQNAQGPHVHDPRTGEILESDILWYHNIMNLLRNWYFIQTAAINKNAQDVKIQDEIMGQLIRFVAAHEVGHTLGLPHNMGSSVAYHVDSLRSPSFTSTHGTAPSIMDYARFNYIAQPGDGVTNLYPKIGEYDLWSIEFGYRLLGKNVSVDEEESEINKWILEKAGQPEFRFGRQQGEVIDPTAQTEDLGHDAIIASDLGIENLKLIAKNLLDWGTVDGKDYSDLEELYIAMIGQFARYMGHVSNNIGGIEGYSKTTDQVGAVYFHTSKEKQQRAMDFIDRQLFQTPSWIIDTMILDRIEPSGNVKRIGKLQSLSLDNILDENRLLRMIENETKNGKNAYTISELMIDLQESIWTEVKSGKSIDVYRRNLQKSYIDRLENLLYLTDPQFVNSDIPTSVRASLSTLKVAIKGNLSKHSGITRDHLNDILIRIDDAIEGKNKNPK